ncbi:MAG: YraN family protein [Thiotrichales bacterium]|nr:YraN family protein [Thiotrichales bacterium]
MVDRSHRRSDRPATIGHDAEALAEKFLSRHGLLPVTRNYRCRRGEIDLVMRDADTLVFVEVRRRSSRTFGGGVESVSATKRARLVAAAEHYLMMHRIGDDRPCRFDVVAIDGPPLHTTIDWVHDAFDA